MKLIDAGQGFFDRWTMAHLTIWISFGITLGALTYSAEKITESQAWTIIIAGAILWELIETFIDKYTTFTITNESWYNRWISDLVMAFIGGGAGMAIMGA